MSLINGHISARVYTVKNVDYNRSRKSDMEKITQKKKYFVVRERAVPEVLLKVVQAKKLLDSEKVRRYRKQQSRRDQSKLLL